MSLIKKRESFITKMLFTLELGRWHNWRTSNPAPYLGFSPPLEYDVKRYIGHINVPETMTAMPEPFDRLYPKMPSFGEWFPRLARWGNIDHSLEVPTEDVGFWISVSFLCVGRQRAFAHAIRVCRPKEIGGESLLEFVDLKPAYSMELVANAWFANDEIYRIRCRQDVEAGVWYVDFISCPPEGDVVVASESLNGGVSVSLAHVYKMRSYLD